MTTPPLVTAIILNWNGLDDTLDCLKSLQSDPYPNLRIIVVDNGSEGDEADALEREFGGSITLIRSETNRGFAGGANLGLRRALEDGTDYALLLNNDTVVEPGFLAEMLKAAAFLPDLAAACPRTVFYDRPDMIYSTGGRYSLWTGVARQVGRGEPDGDRFSHVEERDYADGVCMLIPRAALDKVGLLDEDYFAYWEETDWCARARALGLRSYYIPGARIRHKAERSQSPDSAYRYLYRRNALLFVRKRGTPLHLITTFAAQTLFYAPRYLLRNPLRIGRLAADARALLSQASNRSGGRPLV
jgi:GT2 family glycosyltransferase